MIGMYIFIGICYIIETILFVLNWAEFVEGRKWK